MNHDSRDGEWTSHFYNRYLKVEMMGWLTDKLYYRFRHRLNKLNAAQSEDNFAKATDYSSLTRIPSISTSTLILRTMWIVQKELSICSRLELDAQGNV